MSPGDELARQLYKNGTQNAEFPGLTKLIESDEQVSSTYHPGIQEGEIANSPTPATFVKASELPPIAEDETVRDIRADVEKLSQTLEASLSRLTQVGKSNPEYGTLVRNITFAHKKIVELVFYLLDE